MGGELPGLPALRNPRAISIHAEISCTRARAYKRYAMISGRVRRYDVPLDGARDLTYSISVRRHLSPRVDPAGPSSLARRDLFFDLILRRFGAGETVIYVNPALNRIGPRVGSDPVNVCQVNGCVRKRARRIHAKHSDIHAIETLLRAGAA